MKSGGTDVEEQGFRRQFKQRGMVMGVLCVLMAKKKGLRSKMDTDEEEICRLDARDVEHNDVKNLFNCARERQAEY